MGKFGNQHETTGTKRSGGKVSFALWGSVERKKLFYSERFWKVEFDYSIQVLFLFSKEFHFEEFGIGDEILRNDYKLEFIQGWIGSGEKASVTW